MRKQLLYLAKHGLVEPDKLHIFKNAIRKADSGKKLTLIEYRLITETFTELMGKVLEDSTVYNRLKRDYGDDK